MAYSESSPASPCHLATELPPHVFEEEVEEKKMFGGLPLWSEVRCPATVSSRGQELASRPHRYELEKAGST